MSWSTRTGLAAVVAAAEPTAGLLVAAVPGEGFVPIPAGVRASLRARSAAVLARAGLAAGRRVILSLGSDGDLAAPLLADALVELGASAAVVGPRGRMRSLAAFRALRPDVWITTPTGALDFLARLYLEFNVDPLELELAEIYVVGEIPSPGTSRRLADEFEARVAGLYCDPIFGGVWAHGSDGSWQIAEPEVLVRAELARDVAIEGDTGGRAELVIRPDWSGPFAGVTIRTGQVVGGEPPRDRPPANAAPARDAAALFHHTVGDHLLARGRWLSLPLLRHALARIDGLAGHRVTVARGEGTLDKLTITLAFERPSLVDNPMWAARAREAIAAVTPVEFALATELADAGTQRESIVDERGHHLGSGRADLPGRADG